MNIINNPAWPILNTRAELSRYRGRVVSIPGPSCLDTGAKLSHGLSCPVTGIYIYIYMEGLSLGTVSQSKGGIYGGLYKGVLGFCGGRIYI